MIEGGSLELTASPDWESDNWFVLSELKIDDYENFQLTKAQKKVQFGPTVSNS